MHGNYEVYELVGPPKLFHITQGTPWLMSRIGCQLWKKLCCFLEARANPPQLPYSRALDRSGLDVGQSPTLNAPTIGRRPLAQEILPSSRISSQRPLQEPGNRDTKSARIGLCICP